jgi:hypothetical protein
VDERGKDERAADMERATTPRGIKSVGERRAVAFSISILHP